MTAAPNTIEIDRRLAANIQISMAILIDLLDARIDKSGVSSEDSDALHEITAARAYLRYFKKAGQPIPDAASEHAIPSIANTPDLDDPEDQILRNVCPIPLFLEPKYT
jgi:hypothetical protein